MKAHHVSRGSALLIAMGGALLVLVALLANWGVSRADDSITSPDTEGYVVGIDASLVLDNAGNPVVSYTYCSDYFCSDSRLKVLHCDDPNCAGDESGHIASPDPGAGSGSGTSLELDSSGNPVVAYVHCSDGSGSCSYSELRVLHCNDPSCLGGDDSIASPDTGTCASNSNSLDLDSDGKPVVSYHDCTNDGLKVLHCDDANCTGGGESITSPDTSGWVGSETSLALDGAGNPVVGYWDGTNGDLKVMHCDDPNCAEGGDSITSPDTGQVGRHTSLALDSGGNPVVSYFDGGFLDASGRLDVMHCDDPNCTGGGESITSPDTGGVGLYTSLALDSSGNPVVSYYDYIDEDLKVLHCDDPNCAGNEGDHIASPDTAGDVGWETSLALDVGGYPVVAYVDDTNTDLKVLHCDDPGCGAPPPDADGDGVPDASDNCPSVFNPGQENTDGTVDNGPGVPGEDATIPNAIADSEGDACETDGDADNDGLPDASEVPLAGCGPFNGTPPGHPNAVGGDVTNDDDHDGDPAPAMGSDSSDNGPSWDTDNDGALDGYECVQGSNPRDRASKPAGLPDDNTDTDGDGLWNGWERRGWGTSATVLDSDGDGRGDCKEVADVNGDGLVSFVGDAVFSAKTSLLPPASFGKTMDFDMNKDGMVGFTGDVVPEAKFALITGLCK